MEGQKIGLLKETMAPFLFGRAEYARRRAGTNTWGENRFEGFPFFV